MGLLNDLLRVVIAIENACLNEEGEDAEREKRLNELKDEYEKAKGFLYLDLEHIRVAIRTRNATRIKHGQNVLVIEQNVGINEDLKKLTQNFKVLSDLYVKQCKNARKFKLSEEVMEKRFEELSLLRRQIFEVEKSSKFATQSSFDEDQFQTLTDLKSTRAGGVHFERHELGVATKYQGPTEEDKEQLGKWKQRDEEFDAHLIEIGDAIDRIGETAIRIGEQSGKQNRLALDLQAQTDRTTEELKNVNNKLKKVMGQQKSTTCACRVILCFLLIALVLFVAQLTRSFTK